MGMFGKSRTRRPPAGSRESLWLGAYQGLTAPVDAAAMELEGALGRPALWLNQTLGMPSAAEAAARHQAYIRQKEALGWKAHPLGQFLAAMLTGPGALSPPPR